MEPPSSQFDGIWLETWIALLFMLLLVIVLFVAAAVSGAVSVFKDLETRDKDNKTFLFIAENQSAVSEIFSTVQIILFVGIILLCTCQAVLFGLSYGLLFYKAQTTISLVFCFGLVVSSILLILLLLCKYFGQKYPQQTIRSSSRFIKFAVFLFLPAIKLVYKEIDNHTDKNNTDAEFNSALQNTSDIEVKEIILGRMDITAVDISMDFPDLLNFIVDSGYSRFPVYKDDIDHIKGILHIKDLFPFMLEKNENFDWRELIRKAHFVSEYNKINVLLEDMKQNKVHIAIVVDEYGMTTGIVTLEDILEEIVGDIYDESDSEAEEKFYVKLKDNSYSFKGKTLLVDFCRVMQVEHDLFDSTKGDSETLAGLLLEHKGDFLHTGEVIDFAGFTFTVESVDARRIKRIRVIKNKPE